MGFWKKVGVGARIALGAAIRLNDAGVIKVKELGVIKPIKEAIEQEVERTKPKP